MKKRRKKNAKEDIDLKQLLAESFVIEQMNNLIQNEINRTYLVRTIPGGEYKDSVILADSKLPDSRNGLRNGLAQQLLHNQMVAMQYKLTEEN